MGDSDMKRVLGTLVILVLMTLTPSAFAISGYQLGFQDGLSDAKCSIQDICHYYVIQTGKGFRFHTHDFINGHQ
ncbi:MAG TPA: hypothetical protein VH500_16020 [Nitrososphaeraceae archaeon]|jgi:hypothetical protein